MKLNLLPNYVSKGAQARTALVGSLLLLLGCIAASVFMIVSSSKALADAKTAAEDAKPAADRAFAEAQKAETIAAAGAGLVRNIDLYESITNHNVKYTRFYRQIMPYIPGYFRVNAMQVQPVSENACRLNLSGVVASYQQYTDLTLALLRIPGAKSVGRSPFTVYDKVIPNLVEEDQVGLPHDSDAERKPPLGQLGPDAQLAYLMAEASKGATGFENVGNFGTPAPVTRSAMPDWNQITMVVELSGEGVAAPAPAPTEPGAPRTLPIGFNYDFRVPNARETLKAGNAGAGAAPAGGPPPADGPGGPIGARGRGPEDGR